MNALIALGITFVACFIAEPLLLGLGRILGMFAIVRERRCHVYVLFGTVIGKITQVVTLIAVVIGAGAAAAGAGQLFLEVPEALVEEYTTEIPPGGGLPFSLFPSGGSGNGPNYIRS